MEQALPLLRTLFGTAPGEGARTRLLARWLFLRALGLIYFSAFYSLLFQIRGLIGPRGLLPAADYLDRVAHGMGALRFWYAPTLLWFSSSNAALIALAVVGLVASLALVCNLWPRLELVICFIGFLSFVTAAQDFSNYQSDGMLLEAGFISLFLAPRGVRPGLAAESPPPWAAVLLLLWEWFRIYFESGAVKLLSGDPTWRSLTAMDEYYQNGPLPTWIGWYAQHAPEWVHRFSAGTTLVLELALVFLALLPRPWRIACFVIATMWQAGVILTANYTFLNYLVLVLGVLLLDDPLLRRFAPARFVHALPTTRDTPAAESVQPWRRHLAAARTATIAIIFAWLTYDTFFLLLHLFTRALPLPAAPVVALEPFRIANEYGLFATMTPHRYEIEFQGSDDGVNWTPYPFRYKPQSLTRAPGIYAPYQPRFEWNLWFASLGSWPEYPFVPRAEEALINNDRDVLALFRANPFPNAPPRYVRAVLWQYWFTSLAEKRATGAWWRRQWLGTYAPTLMREPDGTIAIVQDVSSSP